MTRAASAVGPVTVRAEGVRLNGKPVCNRFAIEYPNGIGHIEFSDESAAAIERAVNSHADLLAALQAFVGWANAKCPCENERPNPCPLCGASVENFEGCKAADQTLPRELVDAARAAIAKAKGVVPREQRK